MESLQYALWSDGVEEKRSLLRAYSLLALTIALEAAATMVLKLASQGRLAWLLVAYCLYGGAFAVFPEVLKVVKLGEAYAVWSGAGCVLTAAGGWAFFGESLPPAKLAAIALVLVGVAGVML